MKRYVTTKIRPEDLDNLRWLSAWTGRTQLDILSLVIGQEMARTNCPVRARDESADADSSAVRVSVTDSG